MQPNPIMSVPLTEVLRAEIALPLGQLLSLCTVGSLLRAWANPKNHPSIEGVFDSPEQARHAVAICAGWLGAGPALALMPEIELGWWRIDEVVRPAALPLA